MSGVDTIRGITSQAVVALAEAVSMVTDPAAVLLRVEGSEDVVDYEVIGCVDLDSPGKIILDCVN